MIGMLILPAWALFGLAAAFVARRKGRPHAGVNFYILGPVGLVLALCGRRWFYDPELNITGDVQHLARARSDYGS